MPAASSASRSYSNRPGQRSHHRFSTFRPGDAEVDGEAPVVLEDAGGRAVLVVSRDVLDVQDAEDAPDDFFLPCLPSPISFPGPLVAL